LTFAPLTQVITEIMPASMQEIAAVDLRFFPVRRRLQETGATGGAILQQISETRAI